MWYHDCRVLTPPHLFIPDRFRSFWSLSRGRERAFHVEGAGHAQRERHDDGDRAASQPLARRALAPSGMMPCGTI